MDDSIVHNSIFAAFGVQLDHSAKATGRTSAPVVGGYWTCTNNPEIDIVVADREPIAKEIFCVGSIKWLENAPLDSHDLNALVTHRSQLPSADGDTPLLTISRSGCSVTGVTAYDPDQLIEAWLT